MGVPANAQLHLLAGFEIRVQGVPLQLRPSSQRLLAFLALSEKAPERAYTAFRLWPDTSESRSMANLRTSLWRIRREGTPLIESTATHIRLNPSVWIDARDGLRELRLDDARSRICEDAITILSAELLPDWYDDWLLIERERLRQLRVHTLERWCRELTFEGQFGDAIDLALRSIALEPLRESAHRLVVEAHLAEGNVADAMRQFETFRRLLVEELGVEPSAEFRSLVPTRERAYAVA
jgi:DNA-binding SARP family transcriptional activator